ncbi:hypothetical protein EC973_005201 [Apophysomyces ossiformis]|uniref:AAA+ ATPase domain-containing protein n=1 Tax=Apophysomyces ossiformis TaxID=679940 RepID=A0A8H7EVH2_9FUNG|nr:hypothetical protein EC973_005201 [Apophysomyces ossiformis]
MNANSELSRLYDIFSYSRLETVLFAYLPTKLERHVEKTGIYTVDTFVISAIATLIIVAIKISVQKIYHWVCSLKQPEIRQDTITILVEPTVQDDYRTSKSWFSTNDQQSHPISMIRAHIADDLLTLAPNLFHEALSGLISDSSQTKSSGNYLLRPNLEAQHEALEPPFFNIVPQPNQAHTVLHDGHLLEISFESNDPLPSTMQQGSDKLANLPGRPEPSIRVSTMRQGKPLTVSTLTSFLTDVAREHIRRQDALRRQTRSRYDYSVSGKWVRICSLYNTQGLQSVALSPENETLIKTDLSSFLENRGFYRRVGLPYRRGYFLHGSPGTGKTSLVFAIAAELRRHLYFINLSYIDSDAELLQAFASVPAHSILVFEDVDTATKTLHKRRSAGTDDETKGEEHRFNLGTFLSILDGHTLEEGIIFIMTTNHKELLDPAVIRPGRMDVHLELALATHYQMRHMYRMVVEEGQQSTLDDIYPDFCDDVPEFLIPPSEIMQTMIVYRDQLTAIPDQLKMLVTKYVI